MKSNIWAPRYIATALALFILSIVVPASASECSLASLTGHYATTWSGFTNPNGKSGHQVPWAGEGVIQFDGAGNLSFTYNTSLNGSIFTAQKTTGTYKVNSDCTASLKFTSGPPTGFTAEMAMIGGGKEVFGVSTDTGDTMSFDLKKQ
jgi:hypothetical protein